MSAPGSPRRRAPRWEPVAEGLTRVRVPGGWLYLLERTGPVGPFRHVHFVAKPPKDGIDRLVDLLSDPKKIEKLMNSIGELQGMIGGRFAGGGLVCGPCGEAQPPGSKKCWKCGAVLNAPPSSDPPPRSGP